jgi:hypothetical protein
LRKTSTSSYCLSRKKQLAMAWRPGMVSHSLGLEPTTWEQTKKLYDTGLQASYGSWASIMETILATSDDSADAQFDAARLRQPQGAHAPGMHMVLCS